MRDPARIDDVLAEVKKAWEHNPDLRLGQIIVNATQVIYGLNEPISETDVFFIEDDDLVTGIQHNDRLNES